MQTRQHAPLRKTARDFSFAAGLLVATFLLTSAGWADGKRKADTPPPAPQVNSILSPANLLRESQTSWDPTDNLNKRTKLYANGMRIGTQIEYRNGTTVTYRRGGWSFYTPEQLTPEMKDRLKSTDFRGPAMRIVSKLNKDGSRTTRAHVMESHTGRHNRQGEEIAGGFAHLHPVHWTRVKHTNGTTVLYRPTGDSSNGHLRRQTIMTFSAKPGHANKILQPRKSIRTCQGICGAKHDSHKAYVHNRRQAQARRASR